MTAKKRTKAAPKEDVNKAYAALQTEYNRVMDVNRRCAHENAVLRSKIFEKKSANQNQVGGNHYTKQRIQTWDFVTENNIPFLEGMVIKYVSRWREKGGVKDLEKAKHTVEKLIENETKDRTEEERQLDKRNRHAANYGMGFPQGIQTVFGIKNDK